MRRNIIHFIIIFGFITVLSSNDVKSFEQIKEKVAHNLTESNCYVTYTAGNKILSTQNAQDNYEEHAEKVEQLFNFVPNFIVSVLLLPKRSVARNVFIKFNIVMIFVLLM